MMRPTIYKNYLLIILTAIALFNFVDRVILWLLLDEIKADLHLSDTQLGFLGGFAFALFYAVMGLPIGRWADRGNRVLIISLTAVLWSVAVALCGVTRSFVQLLLVRVGVAVGEAGCYPPAFSLMADYFTRAERPKAAAIYQLGGALSFTVGFFLAGWLNELYGWRMTFMLLASPGLILSAVAWFTLREPRRMKSTQKAASLARLVAAPPAPHWSVREVCVTLWANATFRHLALCSVVQSAFLWGIFQWQPTFFIRSYGFTTGEVGIWLAITYGLGAVLGTYLAGEWFSRYAVNDEPKQMQAMAMATAASGVLTIATFLSPDPYWGFASAGLNILFQYAATPVLSSTMQTLVPEHMRATAIALVYLVTNLVGMGFGPLLVGVLSDALRLSVAEESLRYALLMMAPGLFWGAWHAWRASKTVTGDLAAALDLEDAARDKDREVSASIQCPSLGLRAAGDASAAPAYRRIANSSERIPDAID